MRKKFLSFFLAVVMLVASMSQTALASATALNEDLFDSDELLSKEEETSASSPLMEKSMNGNTVYYPTSSATLNNSVKSKILSYKGLFPDNTDWDPNDKGYNEGGKEGGYKECIGFTVKLADHLFGGIPYPLRTASNKATSEGWTCYWVTRSNYNTLTVEPGDIIDCKTGSGTYASHTAMVLSVDNGKITCVQANKAEKRGDAGYNIISWGNYFNYQSCNSTLKGIYEKYSTFFNENKAACKMRLWKPSDKLKQNASAYGGTGASKLRISGQSIPSDIKQGSGWSCTGTITSNYGITHVGGYILQFENGKENIIYSASVNPNSTSYSLANSTIDKALLFDKLSAGTYYYKITAHDSSGNRLTLINNAFNVSGTSTLSISGETYPTELNMGSAWKSKGTIKSNYNITHVGCYILQINDGKEKVLYSKSISPNTTSYSLDNSDIHNALAFHELPTGTYYYSITAHDASGKRSYMIYKEFTVSKAVDSTLCISQANYPTSIIQGESWTGKGTITSNYNITHVGCYIVQYVNDVENVIYKKTISPNAKSYSIDNSDVHNALMFQKLPEGTYHYIVTAHDSSGKRSYLVSKEFEVVTAKSTLKISGQNYPSGMEQGTVFRCKGIISSNYDISQVGCYILQSEEGNEEIIYSKILTPNTTNCSLENNEINSALLFSQLPGGSYLYRITAEDVSGMKLVLINHPFTIVPQCSFSGEITNPVETEIETSTLKIQAIAKDSYEIKNFCIKISGCLEKTVNVAATKSGDSYVCSHTIELPMEGTYNIQVDAICNHGTTHNVGNKTFAYKLTQDVLYISGLENQTYTGKAIKPQVELSYNNVLLNEGKDYTLTYKNNTNAYTYTEEDYRDFESKLERTGQKVSCGSFNPGKAPQIIIQMKGNYSGSQTVYFQIDSANIEEETINVDAMTVTYSGKKQMPIPNLSWNGKTLKYGVDFIIPEYDTNQKDKTAFTEPGKYYLTIEGKKNFGGKIPIFLTISENQKYIAINKVTVKGLQKSNWTGNPIKPTGFSVSYKDDILSKDNGDFTISYGENTAVGIGTITLIGTGLDSDGDGYCYVGTKTISFKILGTSMNSVMIDGINKSYPYTGTLIKPNAVLTCRSDKNAPTTTLVENVHYTVTYQKNIEKGMATIIFSGLKSGGYTGVKKKTFKIVASEIDHFESEENIEAVKIAFKDNANIVDGVYMSPFMKGGARPEVIVTRGNKTLELGKDYTLSYTNNKKVALSTNSKAPTVTVTGKGNYAGSKQLHFSITPKALSNENGIRVVAKDKAENLNKNGYYQSFKVYDADGKLLSSDDYDSKAVIYTLIQTETEDGHTQSVNKTLDKNSIVPANSLIQITIEGKGNYAGGSATGTYRILEKSHDISKAIIQINDQIYTGNPIEITEQSQFVSNKVYIEVGNITKTLKLGEDIEVVPNSYVRNVSKGTAQVTFRGINDFGGTKTVSFKITRRSVWDFWRIITGVTD